MADGLLGGSRLCCYVPVISVTHVINELNRARWALFAFRTIEHDATLELGRFGSRVILPSSGSVLPQSQTRAEESLFQRQLRYRYKDLQPAALNAPCCSVMKRWKVTTLSDGTCDCPARLKRADLRLYELLQLVA